MLFDAHELCTRATSVVSYGIYSVLSACNLYQGLASIAATPQEKLQSLRAIVGRIAAVFGCCTFLHLAKDYHLSGGFFDKDVNNLLPYLWAANAGASMLVAFFLLPQPSSWQQP